MGEGCGLSPSPETARLRQWTFIGLKSVMFAFIWCFRLIIKWCDSHCKAGFWSGIGCSVMAHWCQQGSPLQVQHFPVTFRVLLDAFLNENQIECLAQWLCRAFGLLIQCCCTYLYNPICKKKQILLQQIISLKASTYCDIQLWSFMILLQ